MIKSVTFPKNGKGYIYTKPENPGEAPEKKDWKYRSYDFKSRGDKIDEEKFAKDYEKWAEEKKFYDENKGKFINPAAGNLIGRTFTFEPGKVNIIFGPNGSGKTTILKAIAGATGIDNDGFLKLADPTDFWGWGDEKKKDVGKCMEELLFSRKRNECEVEWDGNVVYYDNFHYTQSMGGGYIGMLEGSVLSNLGDEMAWRFAQHSTNSGQKAMWLLSKVLMFQKAGITLKGLCEKYTKKECNDVWESSYKAQAKYFEKFENYDKQVPMTILLDEPEVNFDIATVWRLYSEHFPKMCEKLGTQIITVSHNPLVLAEDIFNNENFNVISVNEDYTKAMRELLKTIKF